VFVAAGVPIAAVRIKGTCDVALIASGCTTHHDDNDLFSRFASHECQNMYI
jgi:hypothetical protein